jgi:hypothetical protein
MTVIHVGDGRHIEVDEGAVLRPPPPPPVKKTYKPKRALSEPTKDQVPKFKRPETQGAGHPIRKLMENLVGYKEWWTYKNEVLKKYADRGRRLGEGPGIRRKRLGYLNGWVKRKVKKDMENIEKAHPDIDGMAKEALEGALTVLRGPNSQQMKLAAAKLLLEFTKSKPVAKSEVSVNAAEAWLASLGKDDA